MKHIYTSFGRKILTAAFVAALFILPNRALSQLIVTPGGTPASIINAFIGAGLTISNVQLNCASNAYGSFNGSSSNINIMNGVILTTGSAAVAVGPNNSNSNGTDNGITTIDPELVAIEPNATNDLCVLEFDIVPHCSQIQVRFVLGSEEYPEFVSSGYNDVFGFFVTGPDAQCNPGGYNNTNVAIIPPNIPVSIDNINAGYWAGCPTSQTGCTNCAYYINNCGCTSPFCVEYDGFTVPIQVTLNVCPCATYHWKFAIADAGDGVYDSGVLIDYLSCAAPFTYTVATTPASCTCDGTATVNITSGTPPYTYLWSNSATTSTVSNLCPGTYTVTVTDAASCSIGITQTFTITTASNVPTVSTTQTNVSCNGGSNGSSTANVTNGTLPFIYNWSNSQTSQTSTNLSAGTYTVTVTDSLGCVGTATVTITEPTALAIAFNTFTHTSCGYSNGAIAPSYSGGTGPYTYSWSNAQTTASVTNLAAGTYVVTVTDANNCTASSSFTINSSAPPVVTTNGNQSICLGNSVQLIASGASTYAWSPASSLSSSTGSVVDANPIITTTYMVIGSDAAGCVDTAYITVTVNPLPLVVSPANPTYCIGGSAVVTINGAATYHWSPQTGISNPNGPDSSSVTITLTTTTTYTVTGFSAEGCSATVTFTVTVNPNPVVTITPSGVTTFCDGGSVSLLASPTGTYLWSDGQTTQSISVSAVGNYTYTVQVTDANGCSGVSAPINVTVNANPTPVITADGPTSFCIGGSVNLLASPAGTYVWSNSSTSQSINVTSGGTYVVTVTDANGCTGTSSPVTVTVNPNPVAVITPDGPTSFCDGGSVNLTASGGTTFLWSNLSTAATIPVNTSGTYTVTVTDNNLCSNSTSTAVTVYPLPVATITPAGPVMICTNQPAVLSANTGNGYTYQWYLNSSAITGATTDQYNALTTGIYSVLITDANGCSAVSNNVQVTQGLGPAVTIASTPTIGCLLNTIYIGYGPQEIELCAQAAAGAVSYLWSTGETTQCITVTTPGVYSVIAYDINGCPSPTPAVLNQPINVIDIRCGHGLKKILLCHVPEGNQGNPQTLCIGPPAIPPHLQLHRWDCLGPCSLYYRESEMIEADNFYVMPHPNPFSSGFNLTILTASSNSVTVNIHNMLGQVIETYSDVTEQTLIGTKLNAGIYFAEVIQDENRQMIQIVKSE